MKNFPNRRACLRVAAAFICAVGIGGAAAAEPLKIVISWGIAPSHFTPYVFSAEMQKKKDVLRHIGKSYDVEVVRFADGGQAIAALAAGRLHFAGLNYQAYANAILQAKLDIRVVAGLIHSGSGDGYSPPMIVRKASGITTVEQLKGKRLAIMVRNSGFDASVRLEMRKHGFMPGRDYTIVEVPLPNMIPGLQQGLFDAAMLVPPFTLMAERTGEFHTVFKFKDSLGRTETAILFGRKSFLDKNSDAVKDFFEDFLRSWRYLNDPKNRDELLQMIADHLKGTPQQFAWVNTRQDDDRDPWMMTDLQVLQKNIDDLAKENFLPGTFKVSDHADLSYIQEARRRIESGK